MNCRIYWLNLQSSIDRELGTIDRTSYRFIFCKFFPTQPKPSLTFRVLYFTPSIKGKTLTIFCWLLMCVESLVRSRGVYFHTHLGLSKSRLMSRTWWSLRLLFQELKEKHKWEYLWLLWIQERSNLWTQSYHVVMVVSILLEVGIGC